MRDWIKRYIREHDLLGLSKVYKTYRYLLGKIEQEKRVFAKAHKLLQECDMFFSGYLQDMYRGKYIREKGKRTVYYVLDVNSTNSGFIFSLRDEKNNDVYIMKSPRDFADPKKLPFVIIEQKSKKK